MHQKCSGVAGRGITALHFIARYFRGAVQPALETRDTIAVTEVFQSFSPIPVSFLAAVSDVCPLIFAAVSV